MRMLFIQNDTNTHGPCYHIRLTDDQGTITNLRSDDLKRLGVHCLYLAEQNRADYSQQLDRINGLFERFVDNNLIDEFFKHQDEQTIR